jgi:hypothetical protein
MSPDNLDVPSDAEIPAGQPDAIASSEEPNDEALFEELFGGSAGLKPGDTAEKVAQNVMQLLEHTRGNLGAASEILNKAAGMKHDLEKGDMQHDRDGKSNSSTPEDAMWESMRTSDFFFNTSGAKGNPIAGRWQRYLVNNPAVKAEYDLLKGAKQKGDFRRDWADAKYKEYSEAKSHTKTSSTVDSSKGSYFAVARIAVEEGGAMDRETAMNAACNYALRCMALGGCWALYDEFTKQVKFLYMVKGWEETFTKAWALEQKWSGTPTGSAPSSATPASSAAGSAAPTAAATPAAKAGAEGTSPGEKRKNPLAAEAAAAANSGNKIKKKTTSNASDMASAKKLKADYNAAMSQANMVFHNISNDKAWKWAAHKELHGDMVQAKEALEQAVAKSRFLKEAIVATQITDLKTSMPSAEFQTEVARFNSQLEPLVKELAKQCRMLLAQHSARLSAV